MERYAIAALTALCMAIVAVEGAGRVGVSYGMMVSGLPVATNMVSLLKQNGISQVRIYNGNEPVLEALRNTGIRVIIGVMNEELQGVAASQDTANQWVRNHVQAFYPRTKITHISVGNEVFINRQFLPFLVQAMRNIQRAIDLAGLRGRIKVSTAHPDSVITDFYPPSKARFDADIREPMREVVRFLSENGSPFMVHIHPYFAHTRSNGFVKLDYAMFTAPGPVVKDSHRSYTNVFDAIYDSMIYSMADLGFSRIPIVVTETGWPTGGGLDATPQNAMIYNNNLIKHVIAKNMTAYIFSLYNEDRTLSRFDATEPHFGVFRVDSSPLYPLNFNPRSY